MYVCRRLHGSSQMTTEWSLGIRILKRLQLYCRPLSRLTTCHALWFSATIRVIQVSMPLRENVLSAVLRDSDSSARRITSSA